MQKQQIKFEDIEILKGSLIDREQGYTYKPDEEGFVVLRISGEQGKICGLNWDENKYLIVDMLADMDAMTNINVYFRKADNSDEINLINARMIPTRRVKMAIKMDELSSYHYFTETRPGMLKGHVKCLPTHISQMNAIEIHVHPGYSYEFNSFKIFDMYVSDELPDMTVIGQPLVDEFGQWIWKNWNTKTHSEDELITYLKSEYEKALTDNQYPKGWSKFGGCLDVKFEATGYFHTHFDGKRWWLVDPEGYGFFSNGMCYGNRMGVHGFIDKMENLFSWLPDEKDGTYKDCWTTADQIPEFAKRNGVEAGKNRKMFNFARANMIRAFGADKWWDAWTTINGARLKRWGFNTIGVGVNNYYDEDVFGFLDRVKIPFVWTLKNFPLTDELIFRDFPDVYSKQYRERAEKFAKEQVSPFVGNPYMIGYFVTNEPEWRFQNVNLAERTLAHSKRLATKEAVVNMLVDKYKTVEAINKAWNKNYGSFDDLYIPFDKADTFSPQSEQDMSEIHNKLLEKYAKVTGDELRKVDPDHLNLGMRYSASSVKLMGGCQYYDAFSFNRYNPSPLEPLNEASANIDMPMVIGEWHIGGGDKGLFAHGLLSSPTQTERGKACAYYLQNAMAHKNCVGAHYFEMNDQPLLGRFDGECMEHGVMDICNHPFDELIDKFVETNTKMYDLVRGLEKPTSEMGEIRRAR